MSSKTATSPHSVPLQTDYLLPLIIQKEIPPSTSAPKPVNSLSSTARLKTGKIAFYTQEVINMTATLHENDFYAWTKQQADILKSGTLASLDINYLIEELESMGASEKRELVNRLSLLLGHLLKWIHQPEKRSNSWLATIEEQRLEVIDLLEDNPSLKHQLEQEFNKAYAKAILFAIKETNLPESTFPSESPFTLEQVLDKSCLPK
jgi:hypothetical protein